MSNEAVRVLEAAMKLSDEKRSELADTVGDGHTDQEIEAAWTEEAMRRLENLRSGQSKVVSWEDVKARLRQRLDHARERTASGG